MKTKSTSPSRWLASFTSFCAVLTLALGLLLPAGVHAATHVAIANGSITNIATWPVAVPVSGDLDTWQTAVLGASQGTNLNVGGGTSSATTFCGNTLEVMNGGFFSPNSAGITTTLNNLTLDAGGTVQMANNLNWTISFNANGTNGVLTLNGGTLRNNVGGTGRTITFNNGVIIGNGTVAIINNTAGTGDLTFANTMTLSGFTGTFVLTNNGRLKLPAITNPTFAIIATNGALDLTASIAVTSLKLQGNAITPGVYTPTNLCQLNSAYATNFVTPTDAAHTITVGFSVTYSGNGNDGGTPPATNAYSPGATVTLAGPGSLSLSGNSFTGWNTAADGTGTAFAYNGSTFTPSTFTISSNTMLYAQWAAATATITTDSATFPTAITALAGTASSSTFVTISGSGLTGSILATAPTGLEVSSDGVNFAHTATFPQTGGNVSSTSLYARLAATAAIGAYDSVNVILTSPGASTVVVATTASGNSVFPPYWISSSSGNWGTAADWYNNGIANGSGNTADFSQVALINDITVTLETNRTIGNLFFGNNGGTLAYNWILSGTNTLTLAGTTPTVTANDLGSGYSTTISAAVAGTNGLTKAGAGTLVVSGTNTYTGATFVANGTLILSGGGTLGNPTNGLTLSGGAIDLGGKTLTNLAVNITGAPASGDTIQNGTLNATSYSASLATGTATISALLTGTNGLAMNGAGALTLTNANTFTGGITMNAGTLNLENDQSAANGGFNAGVGSSTSTGILNIQTGATMVIASNAVFQLGNTTNASGGTPTANVSGTVTNHGALNVGRGAKLNLDSGAVWYQTGPMVVASASAAAFNNFVNVNSGSAFTYNNGASTIKLNGLTGNTSIAKLTIGGSFTTSAGFEQNTVPTTGYGWLALEGGTLVLSASVPQLCIGTATNTTGAIKVTLGGASTIDTAAFNTTITNAIADGTASGSLTKLGSGTLTLSGTNTYTGTTTVNAGKLVGVTGGAAASSSVTVQPTTGNTGAFGVSITDTNNPWTCPNLTFDNSLGGAISNLDFNFHTTPSTTVAPLNVTGALTISATPSITVEAVTLPVTTGNGYPLMTWASGGPADTNGMTLTLPPRAAGSLAIVGNTLYLVVTTASATEPLTWQPGTGTWNTTTANWKDSLGFNFAYLDPVDSVVFDDTPGTGTFIVTLNSSYQPAGMTVNNTNANYTISGGGGIGGGLTLSKNGTGSLTLATANTHTGGTVVNAGTVALSGVGTMGSIASLLTLNGGAVNLGGTSRTHGAVSITAAAASGSTIANGSLTGSSYVVTHTNGSAIVSANLLGASGLTVAATNSSLTLSGANTYTGTTTLTRGTVNLGSTENAGTSGPLGNSAAANPGSIVLAGGTLQYSTANQNDYSGRFSTATNQAYNIDVNGRNVTFATALVSSNATLALTDTAGGGKLTLTGTNAYTGATVVNAGELDISNWSATGLGSITVAASSNNATLGISGGTLALGANTFVVGSGPGSTAIVNQTGGTVSLNGGFGLLFGNGASLGGTYNLSGGTLNATATGAANVRLGVNPAIDSVTFNLSGSGILNLAGAQALQVGRSDAASSSNTVAFYQTGGTATVGNVTVGGGPVSTNVTATFSLTGGSFTATNFTCLVSNVASTATMTNGGTAQVTLPAFPKPVGTANLTFDFTTGYLAPNAASANYLTNLTGVYLTANGAKFNVASGKDITVGQVLQNAPSQAGTLTKSGPGKLTLAGVNSYTGNTTINGGTLAIQQPTLAATSTVLVTNGAVLELDFAVTNSVTNLVLNGASASNGVHNNGTDPTYITAIGSLLVTGGSTGPGKFTNPTAITSISLNGANVVLGATNGQANCAYYLLESTNLATPVSQWKAIATNVLNANGPYTFTGTNAVIPGAQQQFYMLSNTNNY